MVRSYFKTVDLMLWRFRRFSGFEGCSNWNVTLVPLQLFVTGVMHEADNAYRIRSTWLCYRLVQFLTVAYNAKHSYWICRLSIYHWFFSIWMCHFNAMVSLGVKSDNTTFIQLWGVLLLFSGVILSKRSLFLLFDVLYRFPKNNILQTAQTINKILRSNTNW